MLRQAIYFYKDGDFNIPLLISDFNDVKLVLFLQEQELERINQRYPQTKGNLYVLVDGITFKLST